jgi:hypothetical protein
MGAGIKNAARAQAFMQDLANESVDARIAYGCEPLEPAIHFSRDQK